jgi:predicted transcriptional regulator
MNTSNFTIYVPKAKQEDNMMERMKALAVQQRRSLSFVCIEAIEQYLQREEKK